MSDEMSRREVMAGVGAAATLGFLSTLMGSDAHASEKKPSAPGVFDHTLPPMPFPADALEPVIDKETVNIHYNKHFNGYIKGLDKTLKQLADARKSGDYAWIKALSRNLAFHGSGVVLHYIYFNTIGPDAGGKPEGMLADHIKKNFGSYDAFWAQFAAASKAVEASGWGLLVWEPNSKALMVMQAEKHQNLTSWGCMPILVCDVWEHAYYLKYQNRRAEYVDNFAKIIDWKKVDGLFQRMCLKK